MSRRSQLAQLLAGAVLLTTLSFMALTAALRSAAAETDVVVVPCTDPVCIVPPSLVAEADAEEDANPPREDAIAAALAGNQFAVSVAVLDLQQEITVEEDGEIKAKATAKITADNNGRIIAVGTDPNAIAVAVAGNQVAIGVGVGNDIDQKIDNKNKISADAEAELSATGLIQSTGDMAPNAIAVAVAGNQVAIGVGVGDDIDQKIDNEGKISADANAEISSEGDAGSDGIILITSNGPGGIGGNAVAAALAGNQVAIGLGVGDDIDQKIDNEGKISADANAEILAKGPAGDIFSSGAETIGPNAIAVALAGNQVAIGVGVGDDIKQDIDNSDEISADANAQISAEGTDATSGHIFTQFGSIGPNAIAAALAGNQLAIGDLLGGDIEQDIYNSGEMSADAKAAISVEGMGDSTISITSESIGVNAIAAALAGNQVAIGGTVLGDIEQDIYNSGEMSADAKAEISAEGGEGGGFFFVTESIGPNTVAAALAGNQVAIADTVVGDIDQDIYNSGEMSADAKAEISAEGGDGGGGFLISGSIGPNAIAAALAGNQLAIAETVGGDVEQNIDNGGEMSADAKAEISAEGGDGGGFISSGDSIGPNALAAALAGNQVAIAETVVGDIEQNIDNKDEMSADAKAEISAEGGDANGFIGTGGTVGPNAIAAALAGNQVTIAQTVVGEGGLDQDIYNSGEMSADAKAEISAEGGAGGGFIGTGGNIGPNAIAAALAGNQVAIAETVGGNVKQNIDNEGEMSADAKAEISAEAEGDGSGGFIDSNGSGGPNAIAAALAGNQVVIAETIVGEGGLEQDIYNSGEISTKAKAEISAKGDGTELFDNNGTIGTGGSIGPNAIAAALAGNQVAIAETVGGDFEQNIDNGGEMSADAKAEISAKGGVDGGRIGSSGSIGPNAIAAALAGNQVALAQGVGGDIKQDIYNEGEMSADAQAEISAEGGDFGGVMNIGTDSVGPNATAAALAGNQLAIFAGAAGGFEQDIYNSGEMSADAKAEISAKGADGGGRILSTNSIGPNAIAAALAGNQLAIFAGVVGGFEQDIENSGEMSADAKAKISATGGSEGGSIISDGSIGPNAIAAALAGNQLAIFGGVTGGFEQDIENSGEMSADAKAEISAEGNESGGLIDSSDSITNDDSIGPNAIAAALAGNQLAIFEGVEGGFEQDIENSGEMSADAKAEISAEGGDGGGLITTTESVGPNAIAAALAGNQVAIFAGVAGDFEQDIDNSGKMSAEAKAEISAEGGDFGGIIDSTGSIGPNAIAAALAGNQVAIFAGVAGDFEQDIYNSGEMSADAKAEISAEGGDFGGIITGSIGPNAIAAALAGNQVVIAETVLGGVKQDIDNSGKMHADAKAEISAEGGEGGGNISDSAANAAALGASAQQVAVVGAGNVEQNIDNDGEFYGGAEAKISAAGGEGNAFAVGTGAGQIAIVEVGNVEQKINNSMDIHAEADAAAFADDAFASANAFGATQFVLADTASLEMASSGTVGVDAYATAGGSGSAEAEANAFGFKVVGFTDAGTLPVMMDNSGKMTVNARAETSGAGAQTAEATAFGMFVLTDQELTGTQDNSGSMFVSAFASGDGTNTANAFGILDISNVNNKHIVNSGLVHTYAEVPTFADTAVSAGIVITDAGGGPGAAGLTTVTNLGGTIWSGRSFDSGATVLRGAAIYTVDAPNPVLIELQANGPGHIFGDIIISEDDDIEVTDGATFFAGNINSEISQVGSLDIFDDGKLILCQEGWSGACDPNGWGEADWDPQTGVNGPSFVYVDDFTVQSDGTIAFQLTPRSAPMTYPQVFANTANLDGTLAVQYLPGFYADNTFYNNIVEAGVRNGEFDSVVDNSILLETMALYDNSNVDLAVTRVAFDEVMGLSWNQASVGGAIEKTYDQLPGPGVNPATADPYAQLVASLFTIDNAGDYGLAMDQLTGAQYAQQLQSVLWSARPFNESITDRMDCSMNGLAASKAVGKSLARAGCFTPGQLQVWARVWGGWNHNDGDVNAPGYDEEQFAVWGGLDYAFTDRWFAGVAGGGFWSDMDFDRWGGVRGATIDYDGGQIALYGGWDNDVWYNRAIVSAGFYSGDSHRLVAIKSSPIDPNGSPDADVVSFYNEAGRRFGVGTGTMLTPFAGIRIVHADLDGFTEKDPQGTGAALRVSGDADSVASVLGIRFNGTWGAIRPQAGIGWEHEFEDTFQTVNASLVSAPTGTDFKVKGADLGEDTLLVEAGGSYLVGSSSDFSLRYIGRWMSDYDAQSIMGRFTWKWGGGGVVSGPPVAEPLKLGE